jgi:thiamine-monophosphate kinase
VVAVAGTLGSAAAGLDLLLAGVDPGAIDAGLDEGSDEGGDERLDEDGDDAVDGGGGDAVDEGRWPAGGPRAGVRQAIAGLIAAHRRPRPPYPAGPQASLLGATSMIDVSDGLIADLGHVADASGVRIDLASRMLAAEPVARVGALRHAAAVLARPDDWRRWVLTGGDDHALVATFPAAVSLPREWTLIGTVANGHGMAVDGAIWLDAGGWEHFRS